MGAEPAGGASPGALRRAGYHSGTRRLSFLKSRKLVAVVRALAEQPSGSAACLAAGVSDAELPAYASALDTLAQTGMITERSAP